MTFAHVVSTSRMTQMSTSPQVGLDRGAPCVVGAVESHNRVRDLARWYRGQRIARCSVSVSLGLGTLSETP